MKLSQLAAKPTLIKIELDDETIIEEYGESLEFWIYDRQPIDTYVRMATVGENSPGEMIKLVNAMVMDENGEIIARDGMVFPSKIMAKILTKVVERLGN
jgi:hypothetical protein